MIFAMNRSIVFTALVAYVLLCVAGLAAAGLASTPREILAWRGSILLGLNVVLLLLCLRPVLRLVHKVTFAEHWWFPWLDGEWEAEIRSNWPKVRRTYEAARDGGPPYDALTAPPAHDPQAVTRASVVIKASLLAISIEIAPEGTERVSRTRFVQPRWAKPDRPELSYVYEQEDLDTVEVTDAQSHVGAGLVRYDAARDMLTGEYWTHRRSDAGLNTAGSIVIRRIAT